MMYEEPYIGYTPPSTGWHKKSSTQSVKKLSTECVVPEYDHRNNLEYEMEIKRQLAQNLIHQMVTEGLIEFQSTKNPQTYDTKCRAEIYVAPRHITNIDVDKYTYKVDNKKFSHEQIEEAVRNTFPEYWL